MHFGIDILLTISSFPVAMLCLLKRSNDSNKYLHLLPYYGEWKSRYAWLGTGPYISLKSSAVPIKNYLPIRNLFIDFTHNVTSFPN